MISTIIKHPKSKIILCFGSVDIDFNYYYKQKVKKETINDINFITEMSNSLNNLKLFLEKQHHEVVLCFPYVPLPQSNSEFAKNSIHPNKQLRLNLWLDFIKNIKNMSCENTVICDISIYLMNYGILKLLRNKPDHHPNFIITQHYLLYEFHKQNLFKNITSKSLPKKLYNHVIRTLPKII
jgi:hypothetical protein